jgi:hypothetical protein
MEYISLIVTAVVVGITVSLDVSVLTLTSGYEYISKHGRKTWSFVHAFWHALFLSIGLGVFHLMVLWFGKFIQSIMPQLTVLLQKAIDSLKEIAAEWSDFLQRVLQAIQENLSLIPEIFGATAAVVLCLYFYRKKLKVQAGEDDDVDFGFSGIFSKFGQLHYLAVLVAMDMWYVTPTLRNLVINPNSGISTQSIFFEAASFILILFCTVYLFVYFVSGLASTAADNMLNVDERQCYAECVGRYLMVILEPLGVFYFVSYAVHRVFSASAGHDSIHLLTSVIVVALLLRERNKKIIYALVGQCSNKQVSKDASR